MKKTIQCILISCFILPFFWGCASFSNGKFQDIYVQSNPEDAIVTFYDSKWKTAGTIKTPGSIKLRRRSSLNLIVEKEGYNRQMYQMKSSISGWYFANLYSPPSAIFGMLIIDPLSGALWEYPDVLTVNLRLEGLPDMINDVIVLNNKETLNVSIIEVTQREIRYRNANQLDDLVRVLSLSQVSEIIYKDGTIENFPQKTAFGISMDPSGFALNGPDVGFEITHGSMNYQIQARFPAIGAQNDYDGGFGIGFSINRLLNGNSNGFYLGVFGEYNNHRIGDTLNHFGVFAGGVGYRFVRDNGFNVRIGADVGGSFGDSGSEFIWRPVTAVGWNF